MHDEMALRLWLTPTNGSHSSTSFSHLTLLHYGHHNVRIWLQQANTITLTTVGRLLRAAVRRRGRQLSNSQWLARQEIRPKRNIVLVLSQAVITPLCCEVYCTAKSNIPLERS
jgi:hypothetical protein